MTSNSCNFRLGQVRTDYMNMWDATVALRSMHASLTNFQPHPSLQKLVSTLDSTFMKRRMCLNTIHSDSKSLHWQHDRRRLLVFSEYFWTSSKQFVEVFSGYQDYSVIYSKNNLHNITSKKLLTTSRYGVLAP